ncbi:WAS/WASL-interacting protein family member 1-like [Macaca thibetana thibetana]|uniref:WAS/WASL-interacting protein family member 1-like n=1 Tax=Macaca thibetana thibetana TaxID=257877 RepID=UPI0021BC7E90|nr:WAS/WASL-interacting protein family member 1-like [Macaca thibetana thibetana]
MAPRGTAWAALPSSAPGGPAPAARAPQPEPAILSGPAQLHRRNFRPGAGPAGTHGWGRVGPRVRPISLDGDARPAASGAGRNTPVPSLGALKGRRSRRPWPALLRPLRNRPRRRPPHTFDFPSEMPWFAEGALPQQPVPTTWRSAPAATRRDPSPSSRPHPEALPPAASPAPSSPPHRQTPRPQQPAPSWLPALLGVRTPVAGPPFRSAIERSYGRARTPECGWKPWAVGRVEGDKGIGGRASPVAGPPLTALPQQLVTTNPPELAVHCSTTTFCLLPDVGAAVTQLSALCGVDPPQSQPQDQESEPELVLMGCLAASPRCSQQSWCLELEMEAFMSDEAVVTVPGLPAPQYTLRYYLLYLGQVQEWATALSQGERTVCGQAGVARAPGPESVCSPPSGDSTVDLGRGAKAVPRPAA